MTWDKPTIDPYWMTCPNYTPSKKADKMTPKTIPFQVLTYDLWGNRKDGWEINDYYPHSDIEIPETILQENNQILLTWLKRHGPIEKTARRKAWDVNDNSQDYKDGNLEIYFEYRGKPSFMLRQK
jgi:hypothetical protein